MPTSGAPTLLIAGIPMHRIKDVDPHQDTLNKMRAIGRLRGRVLDTSTGLGYTAIEAARSADQVVTIEVDPAVLEVARRNPWSRDLFQRANITQVVGDSYEELLGFAEGSFDAIIHDPPAMRLAGDLYSGEMYRRLYRVLRDGGRLFHYIGDPDSKSGRSVTRGWRCAWKRRALARCAPARRPLACWPARGAAGPAAALGLQPADAHAGRHRRQPPGQRLERGAARPLPGHQGRVHALGRAELLQVPGLFLAQLGGNVSQPRLAQLRPDGGAELVRAGPVRRGPAAQEGHRLTDGAHVDRRARHQGVARVEGALRSTATMSTRSAFMSAASRPGRVPLVSSLMAIPRPRMPRKRSGRPAERVGSPPEMHTPSSSPWRVPSQRSRSPTEMTSGATWPDSLSAAIIQRLWQYPQFRLHPARKTLAAICPG